MRCGILLLAVIAIGGCTSRSQVDLQPYGQTSDGLPVLLYTVANEAGLRMRVMNWGATLVSLEVPDRQGNLADVTLGYDTLEGWQADTAYINCTVGRYGNRIARGTFSLDGETHQLAINNDPNHLHGGPRGFHKRLWGATPVHRRGAAGVRFHYRSPDGEENYPGDLAATITYWLTDRNEFRIELQAWSGRATVVNLVHHAYWNLTGTPNHPILDHELLLRAEHYLPIDETSIPLPEAPAPVQGTPFDFRQAQRIGRRIDADHDQIRHGSGYDHCFVIDGEPGILRHAATLRDPVSGRVMELHTDQPGVQLYTGNFLDGTPGKDRLPMNRRSGLCLETQAFPDSPNRSDFPSTVLRPGMAYRHVMVHRFYTE